jgi:hypothetical protein
MAYSSRIGIIGDLHLGHNGSGNWHNRLLFNQAERIVSKSVAFLNQQSLDTVVVLGDVTNDGKPEQLDLAEQLLGKLEMEWLVIPGNHDREAVRSRLFHNVFGRHVPELIGEVSGITSLFLPEYLPVGEYPKTELGGDLIREVCESVSRSSPDALLVFSHFPLISQESYAHRHGGQYAKHYLDGTVLLDRLNELVSGDIACFAAHQHWHRVITDGRQTHIMTASMIEYPMEARIVSVEHGKIDVATADSACPDIARQSLDTSAWVAGAAGDRAGLINLRR